MVGASGQGADSLILAPSLFRRAGPLRLTGMGLLLRGLSAEGGTDWRRHEGRLQQIDGDEHPGAARRRAGPGGGRQRFHDRRVLPVGAGDGGFPVEPDTAADLQLAEAAQQTAQNGTYGTAMLYYAFDDTVNSSRYPNYAYMQSYWTSVGLDTKLDTTVTVADLRRMNNYDLCVLSTHGAYYTYEYGWLWKRTATAPVLLLTEKSTFWNDLRYGMDLLNHRIIKVNGAYAVTAGFFRAAYRSGALKDTIILSETCEFYGKSGHLDTSMADALLSGGAACVVGYVNNVYTVYSRSMLWATVNRLLAGDTVREAVDFGLNLYGADDIIWYNNQGGRRPHAVASFPVLSGDQNARLRAVQAAADSTQQAA